MQVGWIWVLVIAVVAYHVGSAAGLADAPLREEYDRGFKDGGGVPPTVS